MARHKQKKRRIAPQKAEINAQVVAKPEARPSTKSKTVLALWIVGVALVAMAFMVLKMFSMHAYAGDEYIYLYQAQLVAEGWVPYAHFSMAHPPIQALFNALLFKVVGYNFLLGRFIPVLWCLFGGLGLAVLVRRELGEIASFFAVALYLLAHEPLRASSHATGVNMTVALMIFATLAYRMDAIKTCALLSVAAVFTRFYAAPGVVILVGHAALFNRSQALKLVAWGTGAGIVCFIVFGIWTGFANMISNLVDYHLQKTPMKAAQLENDRNKVLFHNALPAIMFCLGSLAALASLITNTLKKHKNYPGLVFLSMAQVGFFGAILLSMDRVWMYYFIPLFPFGAIVGGWLISTWIETPYQWITKKSKLNALKLVPGLGVFIAAMTAFYLSPSLEAELKYYKRSMSEPSEKRVSTYDWKDGLLPDVVNEWVKDHLWPDERIIGKRYYFYNFYLWHESRTFDILDDIVGEIKRNTSDHGEIFGDSGTVPLLALLSQRHIAANEVDTNLQRYRYQKEKDATDATQLDKIRKINEEKRIRREKLVLDIDTKKTEMIVLRHDRRSRFGVAGVNEIWPLLSKKYKRVKVFRTSQGRSFNLYKRRANID